MHVENCLPQVQEQYERYPFPVRNPDDERQRLIPSEIDRIAKIDHFCFGGRRDFREPMRILIAGGGTGDALIFLAEQLRDHPVEFVFVDMSDASLKTARARADVRGLTNIEWIHASLLDLEKLQLGCFDYINCVGVLHHLEEPKVGLEQLTTCLDSGGGMGLMLYGKYGRRHVYTIQELFGLLELDGQDLAEQVDVARGTLEDLGRTGRIHLSEDAKQLLRSPECDAYLVDTYLHGQDRAYSVSDIQELVQHCQLELAGFTNFFDDQGATCTLDYDPDLHFNEPHLKARLAGLPPFKRAHIAELLGGATSMHAFYVTRPGATTPTPDALDHAPNFVTAYGQRVAKGILADGLTRVPLRLHSGVMRDLPIGPSAKYLLEHIDGRHRIRELIEGVLSMNSEVDSHTAELEVFSYLDLLIRLGLVTLREADLPVLPVLPSERPWNGAIDLRAFALL